MDGNTLRFARPVAALVLLAVVVLWAGGVVGRYRAATTAGSTETTATVANTTPAPAAPKTEKKATTKTEEKSEPEKKAATGPTITVKVDGLNFREEADKSAKVIRGLNSGEKLILIERKDGWFHAEDASGERGWLYGSEQYSTVEE